MLAEFFLTPDALTDDGGRNGTDVVREITECLFPHRAVPVALICKLGDDWEKATSRRIARITNPNHRALAMSLFQRLLSQLCVSRPATPLPSSDEAGWVSAGIKSASCVPMERVVVSDRSTQHSEFGIPIKDFLADEFWEELGNPRLVGRNTAAQEKVLRTICAHSDWLLLQLPQIRGGSDDEIVTVKQIIKLSNQLPMGFRKTAIDLHICKQRSNTEQKLFRGVASELASFVRKGVQIQLTIWPERHFVNRELLAGEFAKTSSGDLACKPLWWITMTHVAVGSRHAANAGEAGNTWSLFSRHKAHERYHQLLAASPIRSELLT